MAQPVGTLLQVNNLNGEEYASQYVTGMGGNGIANALTSPDCASGCDVKVERSYGSPESYAATTWNSGSGGTHVEDDRNGQRSDTLSESDVCTREWSGRRPGDQREFDAEHGGGGCGRADQRSRLPSAC